MSRLVNAACAAFDVTLERFTNHRLMSTDEVEARACVCWALRAQGLTLKVIADQLQYHDYQRPSKLIKRVEASPRLLRVAQLLANGSAR